VAVKSASASSFGDSVTVDHLRSVYRRIVEARRDVFSESPPSLPVGWDRQTRDSFENQLEKHLSAIARKLRSGRYTFRPFVYKEVPKVTGGTRKIAMSTIRDRIVQQLMHDHLCPVADEALSSSCHSYRTGKSVHSAICAIYRNARRGYLHVLESDFRAFFDSLDHALLMKSLDGLINDDLLRTMIWRYVRTPQMPKDGPRHPLPNSRQIGVPQGGVLSGLLSNLYLRDFDVQLGASDFQLVRYADDFVVMARTDHDRQLAEEAAREVAATLKLELHPDKTTSTHMNAGLTFVGFRIRGSRVSIRSANVERFKTRIRETIALRRPTNSSVALRERRRLVRHLCAKIKGVKVEEKRRSWIAFFRLINDVDQLQTLNRWLWHEVSRWNKRYLGSTLSHTEIRDLGLRSLTTEYRSVRREMPTPPLPFIGLFPEPS
jgi:RNA-directed DNA polymerase